MLWFKRKKSKKQEVVDYRKKVLDELRMVYKVLKLIDSSLPNRRARKQFWENFCKKGKVREEVIQSLIKQYEREIESKRG